MAMMMMIMIDGDCCSLHLRSDPIRSDTNQSYPICISTVAPLVGNTRQVVVGSGMHVLVCMDLHYLKLMVPP